MPGWRRAELGPAANVMQTSLYSAPCTDKYVRQVAVQDGAALRVVETEALAVPSSRVRRPRRR